MSLRTKEPTTPSKTASTQTAEVNLLPSLGALTLRPNDNDPTEAGIARRNLNQICEPPRSGDEAKAEGPGGWGVCLGTQRAEEEECEAIPMSSNPNALPSDTPCVGGIYKLLREPGRSNGIIYENDHNGNGHMVCVISDNTKYKDVDKIQDTVEQVLKIRKAIIEGKPQEAAAMRDALPDIYYSEPLVKLTSGFNATGKTYGADVQRAFGSMEWHQKTDIARKERMLPRMYKAYTKFRMYNNVNVFFRLSTPQLQKMWQHLSPEDKAMREGARDVVFKYHYLYLGTYKLKREGRIFMVANQQLAGGLWLEANKLQNLDEYDTHAFQEAMKEFPEANNSMPDASRLFVEACDTYSSPGSVSSESVVDV